MAKLNTGDQFAERAQRSVKIPQFFQLLQRLIPERVGIAVQLGNPLTQYRCMLELVDDVFRHRLLQIEIRDFADPRSGDFGGLAFHHDAKLQPAQNHRGAQRFFRAVALALGVHLFPESLAGRDQLL